MSAKVSLYYPSIPTNFYSFLSSTAKKYRIPMTYLFNKSVELILAEPPIYVPNVYIGGDKDQRRWLTTQWHRIVLKQVSMATKVSQGDLLVAASIYFLRELPEVKNFIKESSSYIVPESSYENLVLPEKPDGIDVMLGIDSNSLSNYNEED